MKQKIFWLDTFQGEKSYGGYYFRSEIHKHVKRIESEGKEVVGIIVDDTWNLEFIIKVPLLDEKN